MKGERNRPASRFYLWIHWGFFFSFDQAQLWAFWPPVNLFPLLQFYDTHVALGGGGGGRGEYVYSKAVSFPCAVFFSGLTSPPHQWHTINYYTCFSVHPPSLVSAGNIFCLSFSKVALPVLHSRPLARPRCLPYGMLMGLTDVLQRMGRKEFIL